jgi:lipopolysaccharide export system protein LptA
MARLHSRRSAIAARAKSAVWGAVLAAALSTAAPALAAGTPIEVTADTFVVDQANNQATFSGNVVIKRLSLDMWADKVVVAYGSGGQTDITSLTADGDVRVKTPSQTARGDHATFDPATQLVRVTGNVKVSSGQGDVAGPELVIDLKKNTSVFKGSKSGGRVTGVFTPQ